MNTTSLTQLSKTIKTTRLLNRPYLAALVTGMLFPLGHAPFHMPLALFLSASILFVLLQNVSVKKAMNIGFFYGLGSMGVGVSWVYVSIYNYGHIHAVFALLITILFICFLATYSSLMAVTFVLLKPSKTQLLSALLFSATWILFEIIRSTLFGGFPWILTAYSLVDTSFKYLIPVTGFYGTGLIAIFTSCCFTLILIRSVKNKSFILALGFGLLIIPFFFKSMEWSTDVGEEVSVGVIQANLSMKDKWDDTLFYQLMTHYYQESAKLIGKNQVIIMPESAIPVPTSYIDDYIESLDTLALKNQSSILFGTLLANPDSENQFYNTMLGVGHAKGSYSKQHLVPFGEYIPSIFEKIIVFFGLPSSDLSKGDSNQSLIRIKNNAIASLICYELAYPSLLKKQLPAANWIVSISDDGWFGHSFAMFQQLQMAQALSILTSRYQVVANNDGLSSVIDHKGRIVESLPPYTQGILESNLKPMKGTTPWVQYSDYPIFLLILIVFGVMIYRKIKK